MHSDRVKQYGSDSVINTEQHTRQIGPELGKEGISGPRLNFLQAATETMECCRFVSYRGNTCGSAQTAQSKLKPPSASVTNVSSTG